ncbi:MAG TPA: DUF4430 domain-containing protein [Miltoncostaeaceae bacterium]|nr:DUF4430 domain-containing protein [Miltoncostaeaceae bacterium]
MGARPRRPLVAAVAALAAAAGLAGCERHSDRVRAEAGAPVARLTVTGDFGAASLDAADVATGISVMDALRGRTDVRTGYGGGYVTRMYGRGSDLGARRDWFFLVDGVLADRGADAVRLAPGDDVWWDHRHWGGQMDTWAVVGAWPRPFTRRRVRAVQADPPLAGTLRAAGAPVGTAASTWRVRVGADADLRRREPAWGRAARDPERAGLTAAVEDGRVTALDARGVRRVPVPGGRALAAAVPTGDVPARGVTMVVVGLDHAAATRAAATIAQRPEVLSRRYAVVFDGAGRPLRAPGRAGP